MYPVIQPGIMVIGARQHHDAEPILPLQHVEGFARAASDGVLVLMPCFKTFLDGTFVFFF